MYGDCNDAGPTRVDLVGIKVRVEGFGKRVVVSVPRKAPLCIATGFAVTFLFFARDCIAERAELANLISLCNIKDTVRLIVYLDVHAKHLQPRLGFLRVHLPVNIAEIVLRMLIQLSI